MSIFGWSYPPGCNGTPYDDPVWCEVCGGNLDAKDGSGIECICPECPYCGEVGDLYCYEHHGLTLSEAQQQRQKEMDERFMAQEELSP